MGKLTEKTIGCFQYGLKDHKSVIGEFGTYDAFYDYSLAVSRLGEYENTDRTPEEVEEMKTENEALSHMRKQLVDTKDDQYKMIKQLCNEIDGLKAELTRYKQAEEEGRLVVLPCKVGDKVYSYCGVLHQVGCYQIDMIQFYGHKNVDILAYWNKNGEAMDELDFDFGDIGKTVFLTRAEAEQAGGVTHE